MKLVNGSHFGDFQGLKGMEIEGVWERLQRFQKEEVFLES